MQKLGDKDGTISKQNFMVFAFNTHLCKEDPQELVSLIDSLILCNLLDQMSQIKSDNMMTTNISRKNNLKRKRKRNFREKRVELQMPIKGEEH